MVALWRLPSTKKPNHKEVSVKEKVEKFSSHNFKRGKESDKNGTPST